MVSAQVPTILASVADAIREENMSEVFIKMSLKEATDWLMEENTKSGKIFSNFVKEHGHRSFREVIFKKKT